MKTVLGIDLTSQSRIAAEWVLCLWKEKPQTVVGHVIPPVFSDDAGVFEGAVYPLTDIQSERAIIGSTTVGEVEEFLREHGACYKSRILWGAPTAELLTLAEEEEADLIAVGTTRKTSLGSLFLGSVSRGVLCGSETSVLVAKSRPKHPEGLVAVFATDHSDYSKKCVEELVRLAPSGIRHMVVLTANEIDRTNVGVLVNGLPHLAEEAEEWITSRLRQENGRICERLSAICPACEVVIKQSSVEEAIRSTMEEYDADLLILGAQGHGFFERLLLGSVSFHQVTAEEHTVLVLRPRPVGFSSRKPLDVAHSVE
ncbi:MAG: universal stress protein [Fimbriimonas sp.]